MGLLDKVFSRKLDRNEYAVFVSKALSKAGIDIVHYDEKEFSLRRADGFVFYLHNGYSRYCTVGKQDREAVLSSFVSAIVAMATTQIPKDPASLKASLLPVVRSTDYFALSRLQSQASGKSQTVDRTATQCLTEGVSICLAYDSPRSISILTDASLINVGLDFSGALTIARDNLRDKTDPRRMAQPEPGLFVGQWGDSYESSRMLLTDLFYRLPLYGDPVVYVPSRSQLWVTGSRNTKGIESMLRFGREDHFGAYPLSPSLFILRESQWEKYLPESSTSQDMLRHIELRRKTVDYGQQKGYLEAINRSGNINIFVSPCNFSKEGASGRPFTVCVWPKGADTLLPLTDKVALLIDPETKNHITVEWQILQSVVGHLMEKQADLSPERYRVRLFPSENEIAELRKATIAKS